MAKLLVLHLCFVLITSSSLFHVGTSITDKSQDGSEEWGYVQVRPKAHMFWWLYRSPSRVDVSSKPWPTILLLQGGPVWELLGYRAIELKLDAKKLNMAEKSRPLDNPVGTGCSYVESGGEFTKGDMEAAIDMMTLPAESEGGKFAVTLALSLLRVIQARNLTLNLG
ncbi:serine carboxypeptidase-like 51, partial [Cucurbita maxima]|uniref:Serine carboxypeptidase-like 51 n=1 Tax=Cucurbita maxima TaxID=3661 RepID=A0A6J1IK24_CUCMA